MIQIKGGVMMTVFRSEFDDYGFKPAEMRKFLQDHGINGISDSNPRTEPAIEKIPHWIEALTFAPYITRDEAAFVLAGLDPYSSSNISDDDHDQIRRWNTALIRSIHHGTLKAVAGDDERGNETHHITLQELNAWCTRSGKPAPLPTVAPPETSLSDALTRAEAERDEARVQLKDAIDWWEGTGRDAEVQAAKQAAELADLRVKLQEAESARQAAEKLAAKLGEEVDALKTAEAADPADLPDELDCALMALRAVQNGYGKESTPRKKLLEWLVANRPDLKPDQRERIATVANPDKAPGRK